MNDLGVFLLVLLGANALAYCLGVLALVRKYPNCTALELSVKGRTYDRYVIGRRLSELEHGKLIRKSGTKVCGVSGRKACTRKAN